MPDSPDELLPEQVFQTVWFETLMGVRYELPDMLPDHVDEARRQLDLPFPNITARNVSNVVLLIPKHILRKMGVGDRCMWEVA
jgi:hypothetical protein